MDGPTVRLSGSALDLALLAERASRHDATALARLVGHGEVLATFVSTAFDCLGMRASRLDDPADGLDVVVEAVGLAARARGAGDRRLVVLPAALPALSWTWPLPPRSGWAVDAELPQTQVRDAVAAGTSEFRARAAGVSAGPTSVRALESLAAEVWGRPLHGDYPARLAHTASYLGFLDAGRPDNDVALLRCGPWRRLDASGGSTLVRVADPLGLLVR